MNRLRILWVNAGGFGLRERTAREFARHGDSHEVHASELPLLDPAASWDLICFDFDFPDIAALRLVVEAKKRWPSTPVLMLTMQNSADVAIWALRARVFDLLVKPITGAEVDRCLGRVREALQARRAQSERQPHNAGAPVLPAEVRYRASSGSSERMQIALAHIGKHYNRHLPESELATVCGTSPSTFCREFKAELGVTFVEYLTTHRIEQAKRLLANPGMRVADVAAAIGFGDPSYFTRVFRQAEGVSPSEYRERCGEHRCAV